MKNSLRQDAELKTILRRNDPAGTVDPNDSARLEMFIMDRVFYQPQPQIVAGGGRFLPVPFAARQGFLWPVALTSTMMLGLMLGFCVAFLAETTTAASYAIAMNDPWQHLMR